MPPGSICGQRSADLRLLAACHVRPLLRGWAHQARDLFRNDASVRSVERDLAPGPFIVTLLDIGVANVGRENPELIAVREPCHTQTVACAVHFIIPKDLRTVRV